MTIADAIRRLGIALAAVITVSCSKATPTTPSTPVSPQPPAVAPLTIVVVIASTSPVITGSPAALTFRVTDGTPFILNVDYGDGSADSRSQPTAGRAAVRDLAHISGRGRIHRQRRGDRRCRRSRDSVDQGGCAGALTCLTLNAAMIGTDRNPLLLATRSAACAVDAVAATQRRQLRDDRAGATLEDASEVLSGADGCELARGQFGLTAL